MPRLKLTIAYTGARYAGWQIQSFTTRPGPPTIQGELEKAVERLLGRHVRILGAGRTDAGVHAEGQTAHMDIAAPAPDIHWLRAFRALLPPDIAVLAVEKAPDSFHARHSAVAKQYTYGIWKTRDYVPPRLAAYVWDHAGLDEARMEEAAAFLVGSHDFASFQNAGADGKNGTVRTVHAIQRQQVNGLHTLWHFHGNGFLKQMVRNMMGLLVYAGLGKIAPADVADMLAARSRTALPSPTAPARGLTLARVIYPG